MFIEGLGPLKDFIKVRNIPSLDKPIQAAKEKESVQRVETHIFYRETTSKYTINKIKCFNCEKQTCSHGMWKIYSDKKPVTATTHVQRIIYNYCKKQGHMIKDC